MSTSASQILALGFRLMTAESEVEQRTGLSRTYYACFHLCSFLLNEIERPLGTQGGSHQAVVFALRDHKATTPAADVTVLTRLSTRLDSLRMSRHRADYDLDASIGEKDLQTAQRLAESIFDDVSTYSAQAGLETCAEAAKRAAPDSGS